MLQKFQVSEEMSKDEFVRRLSTNASLDEVEFLRNCLFKKALNDGLVSDGDVPVMRRKVGGGKSVKDKLVDDIWIIVCSLVNCKLVPRVLLRNGKKSREAWKLSLVKQNEKKL